MKILLLIASAVLAAGNPAALLKNDRQIETIGSLTDIGEGKFFTLDYTADYKLQDFLDADLTSQAEVRDKAASLLLDIPGASRDGQAAVPACTAFQAMTPDGDIIYGRNFDYYFKSSATIMMRCSPAGGFRSINMVSMNFIGYDAAKMTDGKTDLSMLMAAPLMQMDGMNSKGLAVSVLAVVSDDCAKQFVEGRHSIMTSVMMRMILDRASTVDEAIEMVSGYNFFADGLQKGRRKGNFVNYHFLLADAGGRSAVIEYVKKDGAQSDSEWVMNVIDIPLATNFFHTDGWMSVVEQDDRFFTVSSSLAADKGIMTEEEAMHLLEKVHQEAKRKNDSRTQWSVVYNLTKKTAAVCVNRDYGRVYRFSIRKPRKRWTQSSCPSQD